MFQHQSYDSHQLMPSTATQDIGSMATQDNGPFRHRTWHGRRGRLRLTQLPQREHPRGPSPLHHHPRQIAALPLPRRYGVDSLWLGWRLTSESPERSIMRFDCPVSWRMCRRNDIQLTWLHPGHGRSGPGLCCYHIFRFIIVRDTARRRCIKRISITVHGRVAGAISTRTRLIGDLIRRTAELVAARAELGDLGAPRRDCRKPWS